MSRKATLLILLTVAGLVYFGVRNAYYLDRKFHNLTSTTGPSIETLMTVSRVNVGDKEFEYNPPLTVRERIAQDSASEIVQIGKVEEETFGVQFAYHYHLTDVSSPGDNPEWEKRMILEIIFYKKDSVGEWHWFTGDTHTIDELKGTTEPEEVVFSYDNDKSQKHYGMRYEYSVE
jgi:hypothetical protein